MSRKLILGVSALTAAFTLAACGGSDSDSGSDAAGSTAAGEYGTISDGTLVVATEGTYRPFTYHEGGAGDLTGYDVDVVTEVADRLGLEVEFEETQFDGIFAGLEANRFDVIANQISINDQREESYLMSEPYTVSPGVVVVAEDNSDITSLADLDGKTTAQSLTSNWFTVADDNGANVEAVEGWAQAITLLEQGRVDATVNDKLTFLDYETTNPDAGIKIGAETDEESLNAFVFTKDKVSLNEAFNETLTEMQEDGTLAELGEKYFGQDVSQ
ncbi:amino acid ABC transporter substrate-binding protein [Ornithinimicrobium sp. Arc0846-15]|nr:amino acid ABC transporter substrate-binding protein [Ornithinimicrobium laminariae]